MTRSQVERPGVTARSRSSRLTADSEDELRRTHDRCFLDLAELADRIGEPAWEARAARRPDIGPPRAHASPSA